MIIDKKYGHFWTLFASPWFSFSFQKSWFLLSDEMYNCIDNRLSWQVVEKEACSLPYCTWSLFCFPLIQTSVLCNRIIQWREKIFKSNHWYGVLNHLSHICFFPRGLKRKIVRKYLSNHLNSRKVFRWKQFLHIRKQNCGVPSKAPGTEKVNMQFSDETTKRAEE